MLYIALTPDDPTVAWVRMTQTATPRFGRPMRVTFWEEWAVRDGRRLVRSSRLAAITALA